jgi:hypothetical protein
MDGEVGTKRKSAETTGAGCLVPGGRASVTRASLRRIPARAGEN